MTEVNAEWHSTGDPFLLAETGGYVASKLNEIVNLELIDSSLKNIGSTRRDNNQKLESVTAQHESIKPKIEAYKWIAEAKRKLERIKKNQAKLDSSMMLLTRQNQLVSLHKTLQENLHAVKVIELHQLESVREILATIDMKSRQKERMVALACSIRSIELPEGILESEKLSFLSDSIQRMLMQTRIKQWNCSRKS